MNVPDTITVDIHTADEMDLLGRALGTEFLNPLLDLNLPHLTSLVIATYGEVGAGKSPLLAGCSLGLSTRDRVSNWGDNRLPEVKKLDSPIIRHIDVGGRTLEGAGGTPTIHRCAIPESETIDGQRIELYEHAPLLKVGLPGAIVTIFKPGNHKNNSPGFYSPREIGNIYAEPGNLGDVQENLDRSIPTIGVKETIRRRFAIASNWNTVSPTLTGRNNPSRIVRITPTMNDQMVRTSFNSFRQHLSYGGFSLRK